MFEASVCFPSAAHTMYCLVTLVSYIITMHYVLHVENVIFKTYLAAVLLLYQKVAPYME